MSRIDDIKVRYKRFTHNESSRAMKELLDMDIPWMIEQIERLDIDRKRGLLADLLKASTSVTSELDAHKRLQDESDRLALTHLIFNHDSDIMSQTRKEKVRDPMEETDE